MPNRKNYPKWFSSSSKPELPRRPKAPNKKISVENCIKEIVINDAFYTIDEAINLIQQNKGDADRVSFKATYHFEGDEEIYLVFYKTSVQDNPYYETSMDYYNKAIKKWKTHYEKIKEQRRQWHKFKVKWDEEKRLEAENKELEIYKRLVEKYGVDGGSISGGTEI